MTAPKSSLYFHISREVAKKAIFADEQDYQVFINFLKDYFSDTNHDNSKKSFTVRGRTYKGHPHRPQNFFNQIELVAYKLEPNRFDLLIKQLAPGSLKKFSRALSTRYAIYFNKKHHQKGTLFKEPYQSIQIKDRSSLLHLTRELHSNFSQKKDVPNYYYSSYPEYLGKRETSWIKSQEVLSIEGASDYQTFVEGEQPSLSKSRPRIPEILIATSMFVTFTSFGIFNIHTSASSVTPLPTQAPSSDPEVLGEEENPPAGGENENPEPENVEEENPELAEGKENPEPAEGSKDPEPAEGSKDPEPAEGVFVIIIINDNSKSINIRQGPSTSTAIIGKAKQDDRFEFIAVDVVTGWHQIKLPDESIGFVSPKYSVINKEDSP